MTLRKSLDKSRLVLIDGHAILHRAYHAFPASLTTRKGEQVNAVYGFTRILLTVLKNLHPEYIAVTFDLAKPTFRHKEYVGYQVQRPKTEQELIDQVNRVNQVVRALNIPVFTAEGYEADDVIASLAKQARRKSEIRNPKSEIIIVTGDKDLMQLVNDKIKIYAPVRGFTEAQLFGEKEVKKLLGIKPEQIIDYKALVGDSSDNYPGVPGIGPKTAVKLLMAYGSLADIYKNLKKIKPIIAHKLVEGEESALLSQKLATIVTNAPVKLDLKACRVHDYDQGRAIALFQELEFRSLINKLPGVEEKQELRSKNKESKQMSLI